MIIQQVCLVSFCRKYVVQSFFLSELCLWIEKTSFSPLIVHTISYQLNPIDEQQCHHSTDESSLSGIPHSSARCRKQPMPSTSYKYWLNTGGDNNNNNNNHFMRSTYAAKCRSYRSHSTERCPRAGRGIQPIPDYYISVWACFFLPCVCVCILLSFDYFEE